MAVDLDFRQNILPALREIKSFVHLSVNDLNLTGGRVVRDMAGKEIFDNSGGNAVIFKYELADGNVCALRLFKQFPVDEDRIQRLSPISGALEHIQSPILASYRFVNPGLHLQHSDDETEMLGSSFVTPILLMGWVEGKTLGDYLEACKLHGDYASLRTVFARWLELCREMLRLGIAHGDITARNVMVRSSDGALILVDYDDLWINNVPHASGEISGTPGYQHPREKPRRYAQRMDDFSLLVMAVSLAVLAEDSNEFNSSDQPYFNLTSITDIESLKFVRARAVKDAEARVFVKLLERALQNGSDSIALDFEKALFAKEIQQFRAAIKANDRDAAIRMSTQLGNLRIWQEYTEEYRNLMGFAAEKALLVLELAVASENPAWVRQAYESRFIRAAELHQDLQRKINVILHNN